MADNNYIPKYIIFDFDGVFTDNFVYLNERGEESVRCSKADSLGLNLFTAFLNENGLSIKMLVLSSERNSVVTKRCEKLGLPVFSGVIDKKKFILEQFSASCFEDMLYVGNDVNDLECIKVSRYAACPNDADESIIKYCNFVGRKNGGEGFIRELIELIIRQEFPF